MIGEDQERDLAATVLEMVLAHTAACSDPDCILNLIVEQASEECRVEPQTTQVLAEFHRQVITGSPRPE